MKSRFIFIGVFILFISVSFSSCKSYFDELAITISGTPKIGNIITASASGGGAYGSWSTDWGYSGYFWEASQNGSYNWSTSYISGRFNGSDQDKYELNSASMVGYYIRAYRYNNNKERICSNILGPIDPAN
ncbi:MAG: hypothetical protein FWD78_08635 [Treponema sp.]|nr:hypothetical protein [Treponema sp.]